MKEKSYTFIEWVVVAEVKLKKLKAVVRVPETTTTLFYCYVLWYA